MNGWTDGPRDGGAHGQLGRRATKTYQKSQVNGKRQHIPTYLWHTFRILWGGLRAFGSVGNMIGDYVGVGYYLVFSYFASL